MTSVALMRTVTASPSASASSLALSVFPFVPAYLSLAIFLFSLTTLPPRVFVALGGLVAAFYVGWLISVAVA
jgi:hypothetical protein